MRKRSEIPIEYLHERLTYDAAAGELRWKAFPACGRLWNIKHAGQIAGCLNKHGYVSICLTHRGRQYSNLAGHRIAFAMDQGHWPIGEVDHWNKIKSDNRQMNLRDVTHNQNQHNRDKQANNTSGYLGVYRKKTRWGAQIRLNNKKLYLGSFANKEDANQAYLAAKTKFHQYYTAGD